MADYSVRDGESGKVLARVRWGVQDQRIIVGFRRYAPMQEADLTELFLGAIDPFCDYTDRTFIRVLATDVALQTCLKEIEYIAVPHKNGNYEYKGCYLFRYKDTYNEECD